MACPAEQAALALRHACDAAAGLEVRVAFGDVWKESLTELSGGQRSLLALSLILAMLLFKPAPIYILDEVTFHFSQCNERLAVHTQYSEARRV